VKRVDTKPTIVRRSTKRFRTPRPSLKSEMPSSTSHRCSIEGNQSLNALTPITGAAVPPKRYASSMAWRTSAWEAPQTGRDRRVP
jgi:hypothetical protein